MATWSHSPFHPQTALISFGLWDLPFLDISQKRSHIPGRSFASDSFHWHSSLSCLLHRRLLGKGKRDLQIKKTHLRECFASKQFLVTVQLIQWHFHNISTRLFWFSGIQKYLLYLGVRFYADYYLVRANELEIAEFKLWEIKNSLCVPDKIWSLISWRA